MTLVPENMEKVMKALVATGETQGARQSDFTHCVDGELVWMLDPCPTSMRSPDGPCACGRSFSGMSSHGYTTTALVRDIPWLTEGNYAAAMRASFDANGWCSCCRMRPVPTLIRELTERAAALPVGAVVERRLNEVVERAPADSARE
ncbi:DUF7715 family protein [Glaciibacter superstes]|uniref:DUF7715 family protein n=1 Tax=Glaciibacter superstes TaxID=501023 RepID=UPI0003B4AEA8|nr:hypothetical protein [Glaciibacter superstes]